MGLIKSPEPAAQQPSEELQRTIRPERDCAVLAAQLQDMRAIARRWAARDLIDCPNCSQLLTQRLPHEQDDSVREVILTTLVRIGDATAVDALVECLRSEDAALRNESVEALKQLPDAVAPLMRQLLADEDSDVRIFAVNVLESLRHPSVEAWLIDVIANDAHINVCATAVDLLGEVGSSSAVQPLNQLKARFAHEPYIQFAANLALKRIQES
ncbi:HEAT repeat protein [Acidovorax sp. 62]|uniref:HEAT repeat domain-containing protein n=1 Tax=Acidovorax sp. 62 TaxID=2035203 RepID=UPI000C17BB76|nr:HEAT repeat domain-containing protein [Acidovorax sp. 62]PIF89713.1 HEAT repeat protein [Acidovorax sp. 62]